MKNWRRQSLIDKMESRRHFLSLDDRKGREVKRAYFIGDEIR
jgi:hypothetical protein